MARGNSGLMLGYLIAGGLLAMLLAKKAVAKTPAPAPAPYNPFPLPAPSAVDVAAGEVPATMAPAVGPVTAAAAIWSNLTPTSPPASGGFVNFPSGSQSDSVFLPWATDSAGNLYTQWAGQIYIVNATGDFLGNLNARLLGS